MKFLIARSYMESGDYWEQYAFDFDGEPVDGAYQDTYILHERAQTEPSITKLGPQEVIEIEGKKYIHTGVDTIPNPKIEEWRNFGFDHKFDERESSYPHIRTWMFMTRKVEKVGWFVDFDSLESFIEFIKQQGMLPEINFTDNFHIEPTMPIIILGEE